MSDAFSYTAVTIGHNAARTLDRTLRALEALRPPPRQILVVDDASSDTTAEIAGDHPAVTVIRLTENVGPSGARNVGSRRAEGPWILFVDADCYVSPDGFRHAVELLEREPDLDGVMGLFAPDAPAGPLAGKYKNFYRHCEIAAMPNPPHIFTSSCFLIRKSMYDRAGGFDESFGKTPTEDNEFYFRFLQVGGRLKYLAEFSFVHDKPMGLARLFREDVARVEAIVRNLRGQLGAPRTGFGRGERARYLVELSTGLVVLAGPVAVAIGLFVGPGAAIALAVAWLVATCLLCMVNASILRRAVTMHGFRFALQVVWYRASEMAAAALGMARAMCGRGESKS